LKRPEFLDELFRFQLVVFQFSEYVFECQAASVENVYALIL